MTQDEILDKEEVLKMAVQAGYDEHQAKFDTRITAFAKLVAEKAREEFGLSAVGILERTVARAVAKEREACAKMFDGAVWAYDYREIAAAIRARGEA